MKYPKEISTYCPKCKQHTAHAVSVYKAGKPRTMAWGSRRQERRKHGYGGQKFPELKRTAKTTKKTLVRLKCRTCSYTLMRLSIKMRWELIPKPRSIFLRVKCLKCSNEQIVFERSSSYVKCTVCDELLAQPAGGKATIRGEILQSLS